MSKRRSIVKDSNQHLKAKKKMKKNQSSENLKVDVGTFQNDMDLKENDINTKKEQDNNDIKINDEIKQQLNQICCLKCKQKSVNSIYVNIQNKETYFKLTCSNCEENYYPLDQNNYSIKMIDFFDKLKQFLSSKDFQNKETISEEKYQLLLVNLEQIQLARKINEDLKDSIQNLIFNYKKPIEIIQNLEELLIQYLQSHNKSNYDILQKLMRKNIKFINNEFCLNQSQRKEINTQIQNQSEILNKLENNLIELGQKNVLINLDELIVQDCPNKCVYNSFTGKRFNLKNYVKQFQNKITLISGVNDETQYYLDFNIQQDKKYILLLQFDILPAEQFTATIAKKSMLQTRIAYDTPNCYLSKTFYCRWQPSNEECSNVIKGNELSFFPQLGSIIEMRISMNDNKVEFSDYPNRLNVNANFNNHKFIHDEDQYVIAFTLCNQQQVSILKLSEVSNFEY